MIGVDICGYLKDKACKFGFIRLYHSLFCFGWLRTWCYFYETIQQFLHTKVVKSTSKKHRCSLRTTISFNFKLGINTFNKLKIVAQLGCIHIANTPIQLFTIDIHLHFLCYSLFVGSEKVKLILIDIIHAFKLGTLIYRP